MPRSRSTLAIQHNTTRDRVLLFTSTGTCYSVTPNNNALLYTGIGIAHPTVTEVTYSYSTIIGATINGVTYGTSQKFSRTTSCHMKNVYSSVTVTQAELINLVLKGANNG